MYDTIEVYLRGSKTPVILPYPKDKSINEVGLWLEQLYGSKLFCWLGIR